jgi:phenylacetate-CoA ligase
MTEDMMARYVEHLRSLGPCFVHAYPSAVATLARYLRRTGRERPGNVLGIILESENVHPDERRMVEAAFGCRCFPSYGHSEKLVLAGECETSTDYHVWPTYGYFELLDDDGRPVRTPGQRGEIVGTGFINQVVPFIRYRTGDYAVWAGDTCPSCRREHPLIRSVEGRWPAGTLVAADDSLISMTALNVHDNTFERVLRFRFYQSMPGAACLRIVPATGYNDAAGEAILRHLGRKLDGRVRLRLELVSELPLSSNGKHVYVYQRLPVASE